MCTYANTNAKMCYIKTGPKDRISSTNFSNTVFHWFWLTCLTSTKNDLVLFDVDLYGTSLLHTSKELCASAVKTVFNSSSGQVELTVQDEEYGYNTTYTELHLLFLLI